MTIDALQPALLSAGLSATAYIPYALAVLRDRARPQRSSWFVWALLSTVAVVSVNGSGGSTGLVFLGAQMAGTCTIFLMSLWRGTGSLGKPADLFVISGAGAGMALWWLTSDPRWALGLSIAVGALGGTLTIAKAYLQPHSEALAPWALQWLAAMFGVMSVWGGSPMEMAYPLYLVALYSAITVAEIIGRNGTPLSLHLPYTIRHRLHGHGRHTAA